MPALPSSLALTSIADGSPIVASDHRNNYAAVQTAVNALITALSGGATGDAILGTGTTITTGPAYQSFTPTWAASGTQPVLGNGTLTGNYARVGKIIHYTIQLTAGTTTTFGTGTYTFLLPVSASISGIPIGIVYSLDSSASAFNSAYAISTGTAMNVQYPATWPTGTQVVYQQTLPWTWATSDTISVTGVYQAA